MGKNLVIVESPAKAKTMESFLGKDFSVVSCYGHVRDLKKKGLSVDIEHDFDPEYEILPDKRDLVSRLKKASKEYELVWLATDEDREGEAISWHLEQSLDLPADKIRRIVFREITKNAIRSAVKHPRSIDHNLVDAQQARRVLDRLVGYQLSPVLWKKIKRGLSAGRVQSAAVRLIVERESEILGFTPQDFFKVEALFGVEKGKKLRADLPERLQSEPVARELLERCRNARFTITNLEKKPAKKSPAPPFTTSTLQQEAGRKLGYSVSRTMLLAQRLYEAGHISYMRTDSVALSNDALSGAASAITDMFGADHVKTRRYQTKAAQAQEAHEAIRPTNFNNKVAGADRTEQRLYELIWKRAIASQMADAKLERTTVTISISTDPRTLVAKGEVVIFDGFLKVYEVDTDEENEEKTGGLLPPLKVGQELDLIHMHATQRFTRSKPRYSEASLVKAMEERGIGRPSTYAPTITTIQHRGYVTKETREGEERKYLDLILRGGSIEVENKTEITGTEKGKLFPTDMAMIVNDFLVNNFPNIVDLSFTADVEQDFDAVAAGRKQWKKMIAGFYKDFSTKLHETEENVNRSDAVVTRELGVDPKSGRRIVARMARFGPVVEKTARDENEKPEFAGLLPGQLIETVTLEDALNLLSLPREIGEYDGKVVSAGIGRYGPYVRHNATYVSLGKEYDPHTVTLDQAIYLLEEKKKAADKKVIKEFPDLDIRVLRGRYGPYISTNGKNVKIPKDYEPEQLTQQQCEKLIAEAPAKKRKKRAVRKK
ncbi:MAG: type I DNA topoisomerase [Chitinivibrionales bacterium]